MILIYYVKFCVIVGCILKFNQHKCLMIYVVIMCFCDSITITCEVLHYLFKFTLSFKIVFFWGFLGIFCDQINNKKMFCSLRWFSSLRGFQHYMSHLPTFIGHHIVGVKVLPKVAFLLMRVSTLYVTSTHFHWTSYCWCEGFT